MSKNILKAALSNEFTQQNPESCKKLQISKESQKVTKSPISIQTNSKNFNLKINKNKKLKKQLENNYLRAGLYSEKFLKSSKINNSNKHNTDHFKDENYLLPIIQPHS